MAREKRKPATRRILLVVFHFCCSVPIVALLNPLPDLEHQPVIRLSVDGSCRCWGWKRTLHPTAISSFSWHLLFRTTKKDTQTNATSCLYLFVKGGLLGRLSFLLSKHECFSFKSTMSSIVFFFCFKTFFSVKWGTLDTWGTLSGLRPKGLCWPLRWCQYMSILSWRGLYIYTYIYIYIFI